jgi:2-methylcitrate dehydratase
MSDSTVERLASYSSSLKFEDIPQEVIHQAKRLIIDSLGCGLGAYNSELAESLRDMASIFRGNISATVLGTRMRTTPGFAAFINGTMVRYLDFNDSYSGKDTAHPSDNIPIVMAAAEAYSSSGEDLITGIVLAYEVQSAWADTFRLIDGGPWDQAVYAAISTPIGAGKVMGLTEDQLSQAIRLSVVQGLALLEARRGQISHWKACAVPNSGRNGTFSAMLAKQGVTGPPAVFEGDYGFFIGATRGRVELESLAGERRNNREFRIKKSCIKRFPAGFYSQTAIESALEAREVLGIKSGKQVKSVHVRTFQNAIRAMAGDPSRWYPKTRETADHSIPYVIACALHFGSVETKHFMEEMISNPHVLSLMGKVKVSLDPDCDALWPDAIQNIVTVETTEGREYTANTPHHLGHYQNPISDNGIEEKYRSLCKEHFSPEQQEESLKALWNIEKFDNLRKVMELLTI